MVLQYSVYFSTQQKLLIEYTIDGLLQRLACSKVGCNFGFNYVGALAYADDVVLLAPTAPAMRLCCQSVMIMLKSTVQPLMLKNQNVCTVLRIGTGP